jgi:hypothetical protein
LGKILQVVQEGVGDVERGIGTEDKFGQLYFELDGLNLAGKRSRRTQGGLVKHPPGGLDVLMDLPRGKGRVAEGNGQGANLETDGGKIAGIQAGEGAVLAGIVVAGLGAAAARRERNCGF